MDVMNDFPENANQLYALAIESTCDGIWAWHVPSGKAFFSPQYYAMLGYEENELPPTFASWESLLHPDDDVKVQRVINDSLQGSTDQWNVEYRLKTKTNEWRWFIGRGVVRKREQSGAPVLVVGSHVRIDEQKRLEQQLRQYRELLERKVEEGTQALQQASSLLEATFDAIPDVLGVQDNQHRIIRYNAAGYGMLGKSHEEVVGKKCYELIGRQKNCDNCATLQTYITKKPANTVRFEESLGAWLDVRSYPILDETGEVSLVIEHLRDITKEKKAAEEKDQLNRQFLHAQKITSLGTLAGGVAHDFNNLLMGVQGRVSIMALEMDRSDPMQEHLAAIEEYIRSASNLTAQLLGVARKGKNEVEPFNVNELVAHTATMFGRTHKHIKIGNELMSQQLCISADRGQIEQVLLNLFINASQAMPDGGDLILRSSCVHFDEHEQRPGQLPPGAYAKLSIIDTGVGMDETVLTMIFDPFFTTRKKERGTGLGLASAYGIIENHRGWIGAASTVGKGSTFEIFLPLSSGVSRKQPVERPEGLRKGRESILIVDDEEIVVQALQKVLERLGYTVWSANGGTKALADVRRLGSQLDLVILDMLMPGLDGSKVFAGIKQLNPDLPVLLCSGYAPDEQIERLIGEECNGFIKKPFGVQALSEQLRAIFDRK